MMNGFDPDLVEIELTYPTTINYSTIRVRASTRRRGDETMGDAADRLTDELAAIVRREIERLEEQMGYTPQRRTAR